MSVSDPANRFENHRFRDVSYLVTINISALILNPVVVAYAIDPLVVTFWRCFFGALIFIAIALIAQPNFYRDFNRSQLGSMLVAGFALAVHFVSLMEGLYLLNLGVALAIMATGTIWTGLLGIILLKQILAPGQWAGLIVGSGGILLYAWIGGSLGDYNVYGLVWLLVSSLSFATYIVLGQKVRASTPNFAYVAVVFSVAAVISFLYAMATNHSLVPEHSSDWVGVALITFLGQIMVHSVSNLYLKHGEATLLQLTMLVQIPLGAVIGWLLFDQLIGVRLAPALLLVIMGLLVYLLSKAKAG